MPAEFRGIPWSIPWKFYGIPWNVVTFDLEPAEFHGIILNGALLVQWNSMELSDIWLSELRVPWISIEYSMEFRGALVSFEMAPN